MTRLLGKMTKFNSTFQGCFPEEFNACVGNNGSPDYWSYAKGFSQAANLLMAQVLKDPIENSLDTLIYPTCFNMRHSVELQIKGAIGQLQTVSELKRKKLTFDFSSSHDIGLMWDFFAEQASAIDVRYVTLNEQIESQILDIAEIDPTGQTFRYAFSNESQKHLTKVNVINFFNLKVQFHELSEKLNLLYRLGKYLVDEYSRQTFTRNLSREKLFRVAQRLPARATWTQEGFGIQKQKIKYDFNLSNRELSSAINLIENHHEFSSLIGLKQPLKGVESEMITRFFRYWAMLHDIPSDKNDVEPRTSTMAEMADEWFEDRVARSQVEEEFWKTITASATSEIIAGLNALFYFAYELDFSENYIAIYESQLTRAKCALSRSLEEVRGILSSLFSKTNAMYNFVKSLYFLNHDELAESLVNAYELGSKFSWLDGARSRCLFRKPSYCGYTA